jgi:hypothetical protein
MELFTGGIVDALHWLDAHFTEFLLIAVVIYTERTVKSLERLEEILQRAEWTPDKSRTTHPLDEIHKIYPNAIVHQ